jgi:hypothetical protein
MSQSALTSPFLTRIPARMARWSHTLESVRGRTTSAGAANAHLPRRTSAQRVLDTDLTMAQSRIFLALR